MKQQQPIVITICAVSCRVGQRRRGDGRVEWGLEGVQNRITERKLSKNLLITININNFGKKQGPHPLDF
jgi:hypothetical protein